MAPAQALGLLYPRPAYHVPAVVGLWKATDRHGNEYYFEFYKNGTLAYWSDFADRGSFGGWYKEVDYRTVTTESGGFLSQSLGTLTLTSKNELEQEGGFIARNRLVYRRVPRE
jgi:hypothetical protein